jgi:hypothetical protein
MSFETFALFGPFVSIGFAIGAVMLYIFFVEGRIGRKAR